MFGFFAEYFKDKPELLETHPSNSVTEVNFNQKKRVGAINYLPNLIDELKQQNNQLIKLFGEIWSEGFGANDSEMLALLAIKFKRNFKSHLYSQNSKLYAYLEHHYSDAENVMFLTEKLSSEIKPLARRVIRFCTKYSKPIITAECKKTFPREYQVLNRELSQRLAKEENILYKLYEKAQPK